MLYRALGRALNAFVIAILCCTPALPCVAEDGSEFFTGSWGGYRDTLLDNGVDIQSLLIYDYMKNTGGGIKAGSANLMNYTLSTAVDTAKAGLWSNGTFFGHFLASAGSSPSALVGDIQTLNNIDAPDDYKLYELFYEHTFCENDLGILFGLHDFNSEFARTEYASGLIHSSYGINYPTAQTGSSIFPTTAVALRARIAPTDDSYILAAVYDGVPGSPRGAKGTHIRIDRNEGAFSAIEVGIIAPEDEREKNYYKLGLGGWYNSADFTDPQDKEREHNWGGYVVGDRSLFREEDPTQGLGAFFSYATTQSNYNDSQGGVTAGVQYVGLLPKREADTLSLGMAQITRSDAYLGTHPGSTRSETQFEAIYRFAITPSLGIAPDFQYIIHPGTDRQVSDAAVVGMRVDVAL